MSARLSNDQHDLIADAVRSAFGTPDFAAEPVRDGLSGATVLRAVVRGRPYLVRAEAHRDALRDPHRQYACMRIAADLQIAPPVIHADPNAGVAIMQFIETRPLAEFPGGAAEAAMVLARMTRRLRGGPNFPMLVDYFDGVDAVWANVMASGSVEPDAIAPFLAAWQKVRDACPRTPAEGLVPSHNDVNPSNVLFDGRRLWLVDWETAFASDTMVDPAIVALFYGMEGPREAAFLQTAFGVADPGTTARFHLMRQAVHMFFAAMMLLVAGRQRAQTAGPIADFTSPDLAEVRGALARGELQIATAEGQLRFAKAMLGRVAVAAERL